MNLFRRTQRTHLPSVSASRLRRQRRQRPGLESLEGRQLLSLTAQFQVNSTQGLADFNSDTASSPSGIRVVVWEDTYRVNSNDHDIHAQMYNPNGSARGGQITVEGNNLVQTRPRVGMDANGDFVVAWQENSTYLTGNTQNSIIAKVFDSNGNAITGRIGITPQGGVLNNTFPDVAMDANGDFTVAWQETAASTPGESFIGAAEYDRFGDFLKTPFVPNVNGDMQQFPSVAMTPDGRIDIAYQDAPNPNFSGDPVIRLARFDASANRLSDQSLILQFFTIQPSFGIAPNISVDNAGNAVVAYETKTDGGSSQFNNGFDIAVTKVSSFGVTDPNSLPANTIFITHTGINNSHANGIDSTLPDIALDPNGSGMFVVAYNTQLLGAPVGYRTVQVDEVNGNKGSVFYAYNEPAFPNNVGPAVSLDANGGYQMTYTANVNRSDVPQQVWTALGQLPIAPAAKDLALTPTITTNQSAVLTGSLIDAAGNANLTLTVNWGDGSKPDQSKPGLKPFAVTHKYLKPGVYKVHATWSDDHGLSRSRDLFVTVNAPK
jgi:hypothetical protein